MKQFSNSHLLLLVSGRCQVVFEILNCLICPLLYSLKQKITLQSSQLLTEIIAFFSF